MLTLYVRAFYTADEHSKDSFLWYKDDITFVKDNYATAIIISHRRLFTGPMIPTSVTLKTAEGLTTTTKLVGDKKLILTDDANKHHLYMIPSCEFDPKTSINILGVPALETFFGDNSDAIDNFAEDGTSIKSGFSKSHFRVWKYYTRELVLIS